MLVVVDTSDVREGALEQLDAAIRDLVAFVEAREPRTIAYGMYLDRERRLMTVVQVHPDAASLEFHMEAAAHLFPAFKDLLALSRIDVYGAPSEEALDLLRRKARLLGDAPLEVHDEGGAWAAM